MVLEEHLATLEGPPRLGQQTVEVQPGQPLPAGSGGRQLLPGRGGLTGAEVDDRSRTPGRSENRDRVAAYTPGETISFLHLG